MCGEFWLVRQRVFWFSDLLPHAKTRDRETTEFKMVLEMFGTGWTSCNEVIRHDAVRTTIPHSHHRVGIEESLKGVVMNKETFDYVAERVDALADSEFSTQVTKDAAQAWKDAVAADSSDAAIDAATNDLLDVLEGRPTTIDGVIAFLQGPAIEMLGEDAAASALAAQQQRKEAGAKYCDCEACSAATEILAKFDRIEL